MTDDVDFDTIYHSLLWKAQSGIFYHDKMTKRLQRRNRVGTLLNLFLSASVVVSSLDLIPIPHITLATSVALAMVNAYVLAFDLNNRVTIHSDLTRNWIDQKEKIEAIALVTNTKEKMIRIQDCKRRDAEIDKQEPPLHTRLGYWAQLKAARSLGREDPDMPWIVKWTSFHW